MPSFCTLKPYLPGIPTSEEYVKQVWKLSGLLERTSFVYLGADEYGLLVREILDGELVPKGAKVPTSMMFGVDPCFHAVNSGTNDRAEVARLNRDTPGAQEFQLKAAKLQSGRAPA